MNPPIEAPPTTSSSSAAQHASNIQSAVPSSNSVTGVAANDGSGARLLRRFSKVLTFPTRASGRPATKKRRTNYRPVARFTGIGGRLNGGLAFFDSMPLDIFSEVRSAGVGADRIAYLTTDLLLSRS